MARKLKIMENEKHPLEDLKNDEITKTRETAAVCNLVVGAGLVAAGILFPSKSCALLGGISVISSAVLKKESKNKTHES